MTYKRKLLLLMTFLTLSSYSPVQAETVTKNDVQLRDDVILDLLYPSIYKALERHFGEPKQYYFPKIIQIKQKEEQKTYSYFNITVQVTTFEGAHNPPFDLVTITFSNKNSIEWQAIDIKSRTLKSNETSKF
ncbi:DUF3888 domain-containing protein [Niallia taxi]|uniref:DUF3888 domain-containing protein n=1 Tax=Niallia taxi TaxID=2499688 RepID=A0A437K731_9BACI|nr:DUF3888 domain-containing protein [Niallia taxi]MDK8643008.1 DUF3888 domain-containing protein [Niallia taxi]MED4038240.1 DUF3888 domain-containing protein [Niallia taxi]MED4055133.1 DUF3888 domain-containing protein [Niallia taxi]MED4120677.1 DUF3888 domain-containing protein [Niallia taxi]RVT59402.1 DUF3888 domain-containing protein [Niallia taxi]